MPAIDLHLRLIDGISASAKRAEEAVRGIEAAADRTAKSLDELGKPRKTKNAVADIEKSAKQAAKSLDFSREVGRLQSQLDKLKFDPKGYQNMVRMRREMAQQQAKLKDELNPQGFFSSFTKALPFRTVSQYTQAAAAGVMMAQGVGLAAELLVTAAHKVVDVITDGFRKAVDASSKQEVLKLGERLSLGSGARGFAEDVGRFSGNTGFDDDVIRGMLLPLRRAGFDQQGARSAFAGAADIAAGLGRGGDAGAVSEVLDVLTKIKLKGGIMERQLVSMGVSPKEVYEDVAKQLGVSVAAAQKKIEEGKIDDPQRIINAVLSGVERRQGGELGTGSLAYSKTFEAKWRKITELPENYLKKLVESPAWDQLTEAATQFLEALDPDGPNGQKIFVALQSTFSQIVEWIKKLSEPGTLQGFADTLSGIISLAQKLVSAVAWVVDKMVEMNRLAEMAATGNFKGFFSKLYEKEDLSVSLASKEAEKFLAGRGTWSTMDTPAPRAGSATGRSRSVTVAPSTVININGDVKDAESVGRRVGAAAASDINRASERAAQEAGSG